MNLGEQFPSENEESTDDSKENREEIQSLASQTDISQEDKKENTKPEVSKKKVDVQDQEHARTVWAVLQDEWGGELGWWDLFRKSEYRGRLTANNTRKIISKYCVVARKKGHKQIYKWNEEFEAPDPEAPEQPPVIYDEKGNEIKISDTVKADMIFPKLRYVEPETPEGKPPVKRTRKRKGEEPKSKGDDDYIQDTLTGFEW